MRIVKNNVDLSDKPILRKANDPESRELQIGALAMDLAEKQIRAGTASSQVITHFLKIVSSKETLEREIMKNQKELIEAKTEALKSQKRMEEIYANAIEAMKEYSGNA